tara:strand:- start:49 stop:804 length:756 start_codon:yes stop_codon:yes gene_type:complete
MEMLRKNALAFAERGMKVFPCKPRGKTPITKNGFKDATSDLRQINKWWIANPHANIGIATGKLSQIWVLDIDGDLGKKSLRNILAQYGQLDDYTTVISGGGGMHIYFAYPETLNVSSSSGKIACGIDVRGDGGYIIAPPSIHQSGQAYEWFLQERRKLKQAPEWLLNLVGNNSKSQTLNIFSGGIIEGSRNTNMTSIVGHLFTTKIPPKLILETAQVLNEKLCKPPLPEKEVFQIVNSIAKRELSKIYGGL